MDGRIITGAFSLVIGLLMVVVFMFKLVVILLLKWNDIRFSGKSLPRGTMGLPFFGKTKSFLKNGPDFMKAQRNRYGPVFKSYILRCPTIVCMDPEINRYILMNESKGLVPGYHKSIMADILGKRSIAAVHGSTHQYIRGSLFSLIAPPMIKHSLLPKIDKCICSHLNGWNGKIIDIQERTEEMAYFISFSQIFNIESTSSAYDLLKSEFNKLTLGILSLPIYIPGTNYYRGLKSRKNIIAILSKIIKERRVASVSPHGDQIHELLGLADSNYKLSDEEVIDQIITILYSGHESVSTTTMMVIKYLHDHAKALQEIRDEHFRIREGKKPDEPIDWNEYRSMTFTRAVIFEASRLASVVNGVLRKTIEDVELNGFIIPKGWRIFVYTREINYDPFLYPEPFTFNPWRWLQDKSLESHKHCFLFGGGSRLCPGKELGIVKISIFLHYFVTNYRWEEVGKQIIWKFPRVEAPNGLKIKVSSYCDSDVK